MVYNGIRKIIARNNIARIPRGAIKLQDYGTLFGFCLRAIIPRGAIKLQDYGTLFGFCPNAGKHEHGVQVARERQG
jgi:hypothetical protein